MSYGPNLSSKASGNTQASCLGNGVANDKSH
jgi:hypothetical protein